jgi:hypothetical protein
MRRRYDHVDLRVRSLAEARPFYETLLPALRFTRDVRIEHWLQLEAVGADSATEFFGITESSRHVANECRIASTFRGLLLISSLSSHTGLTYLWSDGPLFDFAVDLRTPSYSDNTDRLRQTFYWRKYVRGNQKNPAGRPSFA